MHHILRKVNIGRSIMGLFLLSLPLTSVYATAGCCSHHGGVNGCNASTNHQLCKDGSSSPTCLCSGGTAKEMKSQKNKKNTMTTTGATTTNAATTTTSTANTAVTTAPMPNKIKGCCSKHGGVAKCDTATGYQLCKDGTHSTTCKCS